jgi:hypothetical protein
MNSIIDDLYLGNINPNENMRIRHPEYLSFAAESVKLEKELGAILNDDQKKLFDDFVMICGSMNALEIRLRFIEGFRLGAKIMLDVLSPSHH